MAKLTRLIRGQDIVFDTHQSGDGQEIHVKELHLEKRLHKKGWKIRFPLFGEQEPSYSPGMPDKEYVRIVKEVKRTLGKNAKLKEDLAETIVSQLRRFRSGEISVQEAIEAAGKIAGYFDLGPPFMASVSSHVASKSLLVSTLHLAQKPGTVVEINQSRDKVEILKPIDSWGNWRDIGLP